MTFLSHKHLSGYYILGTELPAWEDTGINKTKSLPPKILSYSSEKKKTYTHRTTTRQQVTSTVKEVRGLTPRWGSSASSVDIPYPVTPRFWLTACWLASIAYRTRKMPRKSGFTFSSTTVSPEPLYPFRIRDSINICEITKWRNWRATRPFIEAPCSPFFRCSPGYSSGWRPNGAMKTSLNLKTPQWTQTPVWQELIKQDCKDCLWKDSSETVKWQENMPWGPAVTARSSMRSWGALACGGDHTWLCSQSGRISRTAEASRVPPQKGEITALDFTWHICHYLLSLD